MSTRSLLNRVRRAEDRLAPASLVAEWLKNRHEIWRIYVRVSGTTEPEPTEAEYLADAREMAARGVSVGRAMANFLQEMYDREQLPAAGL